MPAAPLVTRMPEGLLRHAGGDTLRLLGLAGDRAQLAGLLADSGYAPAEPSPDEPDTPRLLCLPPDAPPDTFLEALGALDAHAPDDAELLHPAAVAGLRGLPPHGRFAVTGYTGFGNMLLQAVLREIDTVLSPEPAAGGAAVGVLRALAEHHSASLRRFCERLFADLAADSGLPFHDYVVAPGWLADCTARARFGDGQTLIIGGLPYAGFLARDFGAHTFWDAHAARFFPHFGYRRVYLAMRDPLAGLASNAAKTVRPLERALHDEAWFRGTARQTARYLADAYTHRDAFEIVRFEDMLEHPRATIQRLARDAGGELRAAQADAIWATVGFKPVTAAGAEHLVDPAADKRKHFRRRHLEIMAEEGLMPWFEAFGYPPPRPDELSDGPLDPRAGQVASTPSTLYGRLDPTRLTVRRDPARGLEVRATLPTLADAAWRRLEQPLPRRFLRCLDGCFTGGVRRMPPLVS